ncbi:methyltransferase [Tumidithrix elongata RA019]|uniref:tRNA1(Val) (adenine(37)-N6)-methyltransferase n=1 Tax=Tumidithrix elongata BACA0141 TaxID=2716417 RepID=A0AAW9PRL5_9CYAN|nr:methyltransferase [Tumidithrix elongata RA019]
MPNPYFHFQQFSIFQERCAMKVGTDGVLLGAWVDTTSTRRILDVGTGTGLLTLMLAQRSPAQIDAIEIDAIAYDQAKENIQRSPWAERIQIHLGAIQDYTSSCLERYDLIVSNPPFFENASKANKHSRTLARHNDFLPPVDLLRTAARLLKEDGRLAIIYPTEAAHSFQAKAEAFNFFCNRKLCVKTTPKSPIKRILFELSQRQSDCREDAIAIEVAKHVYSEEYHALTKDFYLRNSS